MNPKNKLILGFTGQRNTSNFAHEIHYEGIPFNNVANLFEIDADFASIYTDYGGNFEKVEGRRAVINSDTGHVWNVVSGNYSIHQYHETLLQSVHNLLSVSPGELQISAAGLADDGGVGFVQVQLPTNGVLETDTVRPTLTIATSHTGRFATQFKLGLDRLFCLNQLGMVSSTNTGSSRLAFRHTARSHINMELASSTLRLMIQEGIEYADAVQLFMDTSFHENQMESLIETMAPRPKAKSDSGEPHASAISRWENKVMTLWDIYKNDNRVSDWYGTAWGAYQTFSTYRLWESSVREHESKTDRFTRNMMSYIGGATDDYDLRVLDTINGLI